MDHGEYYFQWFSQEGWAARLGGTFQGQSESRARLSIESHKLDPKGSGHTKQVRFVHLIEVGFEQALERR